MHFLRVLPKVLTSTNQTIIMNIFKKIYLRAKAARNLDKAIQRAEDAYIRYGTRCYVIPNGHALAIVDRKTFRRYKPKNGTREIRTMNDVQRLCFYYTPRFNGSEPMPPAEQKRGRLKYYKSQGLLFQFEE